MQTSCKRGATLFRFDVKTKVLSFPEIDKDIFGVTYQLSTSSVGNVDFVFSHYYKNICDNQLYSSKICDKPSEKTRPIA